MNPEPTYDSLRTELETVIARHNDLVTETPGYVAAMLLHEADDICGKYGVKIESIDEDDGVDGVYVVQFESNAALLGVCRDLDKLDRLESDIAMIDDRAGGSA